MFSNVSVHFIALTAFYMKVHTISIILQQVSFYELQMTLEIGHKQSLKTKLSYLQPRGRNPQILNKTKANVYI